MIGFAQMEKEKKMNDDVISRQAVLRCIKESRENIDWGQSEDGDAFLHYSAALYRTIASEECLPAIEPKRGKWKCHYEILEKTSEYIISASGYECSECGTMFHNQWDFCGNCGAIMEKADEN